MKKEKFVIDGPIYYRPQRSCGKVMFSKACVKNSVHSGVCMAGRVQCDRGYAWQGGHAWQGALHGRGHVWQGACMAGEHAWQGACMVGGHAWQGAGLAVGGVCGIYFMFVGL